VVFPGLFHRSQTTILGQIWGAFQVLLTLLACAYYAASTYHDDAPGISIEEALFGIAVALDLFLRFYASEHRTSFLLRPSALVDVVTLLPLLANLLSPHWNGPVPIFLR
jgi:hypothetical protein